MKQRITMMCAGVALLLMGTVAAAGGDQDAVAKVCRLVPADLPLVAVVRDIEKLDRTIADFRRRVDPDGSGDGILDGIKGDLPIADWVDFSAPMVVAQTEVGGMSESWAMWVRVPDFQEKIKGFDGATLKEGVWYLTIGDTEQLRAKRLGEYVIVSSPGALAAATKEGKSLEDALGSRLALLRNRDALIHLNMESLRPTAQAGLAQAGQMLPMLPMLLGPQLGGVDPMALQRVLGGVMEGVGAFVDQLAYLDISLGMSSEAIEATLVTGYRDGPIKDYLAKQKPASARFLSSVEAQPFFLAIAYEIPGEVSPFFDYVFEKTLGALEAPASANGENAAAAPDTSVKEALEAARALNRRVQGMEQVMSFTPEGVKIEGAFMGKDAKRLMVLNKEYMDKAAPLMKKIGMGAKFEALGSRKIGSTEVEEYKMDVGPAMAGMGGGQAADAMKYAMGVMGRQLRFCVGNDKDMARTFSGAVQKPLANDAYVKEALAKLPARRNAVVLIDPAGIFSMVMAQMGGMGSVEPLPPGPPIAISVSLAGEPARIDIHVPLSRIEEIMKAASPPDPM